MTFCGLHVAANFLLNSFISTCNCLCETRDITTKHSNRIGSTACLILVSANARDGESGVCRDEGEGRQLRLPRVRNAVKTAFITTYNLCVGYANIDSIGTIYETLSKIYR